MCADPVEIGDCRAVAGEQQMVAVIDMAAESRIEIRAAAPAGVAARLVEPHAAPGIGQRYCCGKPGEPGADDICLPGGGHATRIDGIPTNLPAGVPAVTASVGRKSGAYSATVAPAQPF